VRPLRALRLAGAAVAWLGLAIGAIWGAYLTVIGIAADRSTRRQPARADAAAPSTRFRVLVPAHNEERLIGATLDALAELDYPTEMFEVHVVADNCDDRTTEITRSRTGVAVHERTDLENRGKGAALAWLIDRLEPAVEAAAFVVIDADTIVHPRLLVEFDVGFATSDVSALQGYYTVKDAADGGDVGFRAAALAVRHFVRPAGRTALGGSSSLYGNAMAFREPIARSFRWSNGLTEDLEMGLRLLLEGHLVGFASRAVVEAEMPATLEDSATQNERWEAGRYAVAVDAVPRLLQAARTGAHGRRWAYIDAVVDITMPPLTTAFGTTVVAGVASVGLSRGRYRLAAASVAVAAAGLQGLHVEHSLRVAGVAPEVRRSLARTPIHILWKSRILARVVRGGPSTWVRTARSESEVAL
jgi:cellulose synthase/poly-beta-1,6-N-acetylglucosamine synthase-like glycosyltransferase